MQCDMHVCKCATCMRKMTCEVYLSTHTVGYSGSPSTVNETNCNEKKITLKKSYELISNSIHDVLEEGCHILVFFFWRNRLFNLVA